MRKSFILHIDSLDVLDDLNDKQKAELFDAIRDYQNGNEIKLSGLMKAVFKPFENQFKRDKKKYKSVVERNRENGKKGGRPKTQTNPKNPVGYSETQKNPKEPKKADSDSDSDSDSKNDNVNDSKNDNNSDSNIKKETQKKEPSFSKEKIEGVLKFYNANRNNLPEVKKLTKKRETAIRQRLKEYSADDMRDVILKTKNSNFLQGENDRNWNATFDWLMESRNFIKVLEDNYINKKNTNGKKTDGYHGDYTVSEAFKRKIAKHMES